MRRRTLLSTVAAGATSGLAGCSGLLGESTPLPADELPPVTVEYRWSGGLSPVAETVVTVEAEEVSYTTSCHRDDQRGIDVDRPVATETYREVQRLVVDSAPPTWQERYPCRDVCATDDGINDLAVTVDGKRYETTIDPIRTLPARLRALINRLDAIKSQFHDLDHCLDADV